jgi:hypothetical protein
MPKAIILSQIGISAGRQCPRPQFCAVRPNRRKAKVFGDHPTQFSEIQICAPELRITSSRSKRRCGHRPVWCSEKRLQHAPMSVSDFRFETRKCVRKFLRRGNAVLPGFALSSISHELGYRPRRHGRDRPQIAVCSRFSFSSEPIPVESSLRIPLLPAQGVAVGGRNDSISGVVITERR